MKKLISLVCMFSLVALIGCDNHSSSSDSKQQKAQETLLQEATSQVGMPAIKNFRERKILKDILELRDQDGLVTYTYAENTIPKVEPGKTALGGKFTFMGETIGYPIPYATQFTNPQKVVVSNEGTAPNQRLVIPQADPNALFSPESAEASWVLMRNPDNGKVLPVYSESRLTCFTFKLAPD